MNKIIITALALSMVAGGNALAGSASSTSVVVAKGGSFAFAASSSSSSSSSSGGSTASAKGVAIGSSGGVTLSVTKDGVTTTKNCSAPCGQRLH